MSINNIHENIKKAHDIRSNVVSIMREFVLDPFREEKSKVYHNRHLSEEGKQVEMSRVRDYFEVEAMRNFRDMKKAFHEALNTARSEAEKILTQPLPKVDERKQELFNQKISQVRAAVMFSAGASTALEALEGLLHFEEPALAKQAADITLELSKGILSELNGEERLKVKKQLGAIHAELAKRGQPKDAQEARQALDTVNDLSGSRLAKDLIINALREISPNISKYANDPDKYFEIKGEFVKKVELESKFWFKK